MDGSRSMERDGRIVGKCMRNIRPLTSAKPYFVRDNMILRAPSRDGDLALL